jgi:hypothetical protein
MRQNSFKTQATGPPRYKLIFKRYRKEQKIASVNVKGAETTPIAADGEQKTLICESLSLFSSIRTSQRSLWVLPSSTSEHELECQEIMLESTPRYLPRICWKGDIAGNFRRKFDSNRHISFQFLLFGKIYNESQTNSKLSNSSKVQNTLSWLSRKTAGNKVWSHICLTDWQKS